MTAPDLRTLTASVRVLWDAMNAARVDYFRELLALRTLQGDAKAIDRATRQLRNILNTQRPKAGRAPKKDPK
ncbi:hypothetical protein HK414_12980 [Ramlibacter terrae]|uniref:50S ribosomal protein L29 n=1 Tax=Ramlibacter terrae TaxID=2732511 RepID=A0ABX6P2L9_9BURK|nr:hypothetical protein HK414_12980 [Ramlibacter terrae]